MYRIFASLLLFCAPFVVTPLAASAAPITVPTGLNIGDQYRLAFVTSTTRDATSSNIADYNSFVAAVAAAQPELSALGTTWVAVGSTTSIDARDNTGTHPSNIGVPIYRLDDTRIADDNADLWDSTLLAPLITDQDGTHIGANVWTGTIASGSAHPSLYLGSTTAVVGFSFSTDEEWVAATAAGRDSPRQFYAISGVLTVVPKPGTMTLVCIGATAVVGWQLRRRRHGIRQ